MQVLGALALQADDFAGGAYAHDVIDCLIEIVAKLDLTVVSL
jgi:hypothetical protein